MSVAIKLVQPDGKSPLLGGKGEDGGFDMKTGLGVVKFAGSMYMNMTTGKMLMNAFNTSMAGNLQGMHAGQSRAHEYADLTDALQGASKGCG